MNAPLFSHRVKAEAASGISGRKKCVACLKGMLVSAGFVGSDKIVFKTENPDVCDLFFRLCAHAAGESGVGVFERRSSSGSPRFEITVSGKSAVSAVLEDAGAAVSPDGGLFEPFSGLSEGDVGPFLAGVFLGCGTVVEPQKSYHLEFVMQSVELCRGLSGLLEGRIGFGGGITPRKSASVLYFKESEQIEDILTLIGAQKESLELMNVKIYKDLRNHANRATNCDTANLERQNRSAAKQIEAIEKIASGEKGLFSLPDELRELCLLRLEYPEMSLSELSLKTNPPLSRSGINHRFARILAAAEKIGGKNA